MPRKCPLLVSSLMGLCLSLPGSGVLRSATGGESPAQIWDFGFVPQKSEVSHRFYLNNPGSAPLEVSKIEAGCSCVSVHQLPEPIAPGDSAAIPVTFKSGRYQGHVRKTTKVYAGDGKEAFQFLTIIANVVKQDEATGHVRIIPPILKWKLSDGVIGADSDILTITNDGPGAYHVSLLEIPSGAVRQAQLPPGNMLDKEVQLSLAPSKERVPPDVGSPSITLSFEGQDTTVVTIPVVLED